MDAQLFRESVLCPPASLLHSCNHSPSYLDGLGCLSQLPIKIHPYISNLFETFYRQSEKMPSGNEYMIVLNYNTANYVLFTLA